MHRDSTNTVIVFRKLEKAIGGLPANLAIRRHYHSDPSSQGNGEFVFDASYAGGSPCGCLGLFSLIKGTNRTGEGHLAAVGRHINVLGIDLGVSHESLLDCNLDRGRLGSV